MDEISSDWNLGIPAGGKVPSVKRFKNMENSENVVLEFLQEKGDSFTKLSNIERKRFADLGENPSL